PSLPGEDPGLLALIALDDHDRLETGHVPPYLDDLGELRRVLHDERPDLGVVDDVLDEVRRVGGVDRDGPAAGREDGEVGLDPLGAAGREDAHRLVLLPPEGEEAQGDLTNDLPALPPAARLPGPPFLALLGRARP